MFADIETQGQAGIVLDGAWIADTYSSIGTAFALKNMRLPSVSTSSAITGILIALPRPMTVHDRVGLPIMIDTRDESPIILILSKGNDCSNDSDAQPVPKSSMAILTPSSLRAAESTARGAGR